MIARVLRRLLERRLFRLGQRTGTLVTSPSSDEPFDDPADFGDMVVTVHSEDGDFIGWVHEPADTNQNG